MVSRLRSCAPVVRFCQKLNRVKTLEDDMMETSLKRCLTTVDLTLLGIGGMVGSGLYVLTGTVAKETAGPAVVISFLLAGLASLLAAFCYAEFGARVPKTGSAYMFTYISVGEIWAFLIGWNVILEYMIGGAAVARAWSGYLDSIFNHTIKNFTETHIVSWHVPFIAHYPDLLAAGILLVATVFVSFGARVSSWLNHVFSAVSMVVILFILIFGFVLAKPVNWSMQEGGFAPYGMSGILAGTATCFYAFVGFDVIAASSEETMDPQKAIPIATAVSLGMATGAYILVSTVLTLMVPWHTLDPESALSDAFYRRGYSWAGFIVAIGSICAMNTVLLSNLFSLPRIVYAMAEDGLFFQVFAWVHPVTKVPVIAIVVFGILMAILALIFDLEALVQFLSIGTLLAYTFVAASVIVLRFQPNKPSSSPSATQPPASQPSSPAQDSGELKEYESFSEKLQLVEMQKKAKERREPGQLRPVFDPYLKFLNAFEPGEVVTISVVSMVVCAICMCIILVFGTNQLQLPLWSVCLLAVLCGTGYLLSLFFIWVHEQQHIIKTFQVPLVPLIPGLSILMNVFLMLKLSAMTWIRFSVWLLVGLLVYFGYGIWHSKENLREPKPHSVAARYVVLPSGSLVETVQAVQPDPQEGTGLGEGSKEEKAAR
ncbi:cationic amino acid transporter 4-like [Acipenser oxyrinchus oxyrinchus]|uniref:Cationic amino acid transporter 4-like n=1 Tax=Acipenser oxyrinchus oxyrinchus TaxID=40147 RepID=A0AAD8FZV5_ACIOX|nr:cationic amino acid transporter 4-like [Acipenser oxyrinchus oxyrinchus]